MVFSRSFQIIKPTILDRLRWWWSPPHFTLFEAGIKECLPEHLHDHATSITDPLKRHASRAKTVTLYYPGCGQDLVWPLLILNSVAKDATKWTIIGHDVSHVLGALISTTQTITGNTVFSHLHNKKDGVDRAQFTYSDKTITILFHHGDAVEEPSHLINDGYDIYLERGFEIMRNQRPGFVEEAISSLRKGGLAITDAEFSKTPSSLKKADLTLPPFGPYGKPTLYQKK